MTSDTFSPVNAAQEARPQRKIAVSGFGPEAVAFIAALVNKAQEQRDYSIELFVFGIVDLSDHIENDAASRFLSALQKAEGVISITVQRELINTISFPLDEDRILIQTPMGIREHVDRLLLLERPSSQNRAGRFPVDIMKVIHARELAQGEIDDLITWCIGPSEHNSSIRF